MKKLKQIGTAAALSFMLVACGSEKNPQVNKLQTQPGATEKQPTTQPTTPAVAPRRMELDPMLVELLKKQDPMFDPAAHCFMLNGQEVTISTQGCDLKGSEKGEQGQKAKPTTFTLTVEEEKPAGKGPGQKGEIEKPIEGPKQGQIIPAPRLFYLVLKGKPEQKGKQGQLIAIPDTRVGEFVIEQLPVEEVTGKPGQLLPVEPVQGKPPVAPPTQGKPPVVTPPTQKPPVVEQPPTQGKPPVVEPPTQKPPVVEQPPTQGKPPVVEQPTQKPGKQASKPLNLREAVTLTKLCTDEYFNVCQLLFVQGRITGLKLLKDDFQVGGEELAQQVPSQKGKETPVTPVTPAPKQGQKEVPVVVTPAPKQGQKEMPIGEKKPEQKQGKKELPIEPKPEQKQGKTEVPPTGQKPS